MTQRQHVYWCKHENVLPHTTVSIKHHITLVCPAFLSLSAGDWNRDSISRCFSQQTWDNTPGLTPCCLRPAISTNTKTHVQTHTAIKYFWTLSSLSSGNGWYASKGIGFQVNFLFVWERNGQGALVLYQKHLCYDKHLEKHWKCDVRCWRLMECSVIRRCISAGCNRHAAVWPI